MRTKNFEHGLALDAAVTVDFFPWGMADNAVLNVDERGRDRAHQRPAHRHRGGALMLRELNRRLRRLQRAARRGRPGREGFSLVEIMIVLMILSVGVLPIAVIQHQARARGHRGRPPHRGHHHRPGPARAGQGPGLRQRRRPRTGSRARSPGQVQVTNVSFGLDRVDVTVTWNTANAAEDADGLEPDVHALTRRPCRGTGNRKTR